MKKIQSGFFLFDICHHYHYHRENEFNKTLMRMKHILDWNKSRPKKKRQNQYPESFQ